jgi:hypothetical protein
VLCVDAGLAAAARAARRRSSSFSTSFMALLPRERHAVYGVSPEITKCRNWSSRPRAQPFLAGPFLQEFDRNAVGRLDEGLRLICRAAAWMVTPLSIRLAGLVDVATSWRGGQIAPALSFPDPNCRSADQGAFFRSRPYAHLQAQEEDQRVTSVRVEAADLLQPQSATKSSDCSTSVIRTIVRR